MWHSLFYTYWHNLIKTKKKLNLVFFIIYVQLEHINIPWDL